MPQLPQPPIYQHLPAHLPIRGRGRGCGHDYENIINPFQMVQPAPQAPTS